MVGEPRRHARLVASLLAWYSEHRRDLVIRASRDPYAVWVGEVMSQQTRIGRVGTALPEFLARFPDVASLAAASAADVVRAWGGLGYPRRALALRDAARVMVERHDGRLPRDVTELEALPGIGPYTARAVAATAFDVPVTALDVNARRVIGRVLGGAPLPGPVAPAVQAQADALAPTGSASDWNHALMDLGAQVCRVVPDCPACPIRRWCAYAAGARPHGTASRVRRAGTPFHATNRYVRGRVLALLREAPPGTWTTLDAGTFALGPERIGQAARELATDGLIELRDDPAGGLEGRLSVS